MAENYLTGLKNIIYYLLVRIDSSILVEVNQIKQMFRKDLFPEQKTTKENVKTYLWYINNLQLSIFAIVESHLFSSVLLAGFVHIIKVSSVIIWNSFKTFSYYLGIENLKCNIISRNLQEIL